MAASMAQQHWKQWNLKPGRLDGFGDSINAEVFRFAVYSNNAVCRNWTYITTTHGAEMWRSTRNVVIGRGDHQRISATTTTKAFLLPRRSAIICTLEQENTATGGEAWRCHVCDGSD